jgi:hypothetical protein
MRAAMWRIARLGILVCLMSGLAWQQGRATVPMPQPEDGTVANGIFTNAYFNLTYPLPSGWGEGMRGSGPSEAGYYVLDTFRPSGELSSTILVTAQDMFFAGKEFGDASAMARDLSETMSRLDGMTIDRPPSEVKVARRLFSRVDFSGVGLFRSVLITEIRCHFVSFNLTAKSPEQLAALVQSLDEIGFADDRADRTADPMCAGNLAGTSDILARVDPIAVGPALTRIPVRIVVRADGSVEHVHVIRGTAVQRESIENALGRWKFKPHEIGSRAIRIETGLLIEFMPDGATRYSTAKQGLLVPASGH